MSATLATPPVAATSADGENGYIDASSGNLVIEAGDGGLVIKRNWRRERRDKTFTQNLAEELSDSELGRIAEEVLAGIEADDQSRQEYLDTTAKAIELLGLRIEEQKSGSGASSAPLEGMSTIRHPMLLEAALRFQANARGELLPADGPVKVRNDGSDTQGQDNLADALEQDFNHYLTTTATEYYQDTDRMLFRVGLTGCAFKKVYNCPLRRRPVSESVEATNVIVDHAATDLRNAERITHQIMMRHSMVRRMQKAGVYRYVPLGQPTETANAVQEAVSAATGIVAQTQFAPNHRHTLYECYTELTLDDDADGDLPSPYRVTIDKDSRQILELTRNWKQDDKLKQPRAVFVKFPYVSALGFYDIGLMHILGNTALAMTAAWRLMLDAGMFANFPGFIYSKNAGGAGRQLTNEFRLPPGGGVGFETGGMDIRTAVMPLPYKGPDAALIQLAEAIEQTSQRLGGTAEINVGEGQATAPVGTTLALIEQATKPMEAVLKRLHSAQAEEFQLLKERFQEDPAAFWRFNPKPSADWHADEQKFVAALEDADLVPASDPNTSSQMHRVMKAAAAYEVAKAAPMYFDIPDMLKYLFDVAGIPDAAKFVLAQPNGPGPPPAPPPDPVKIATLQLKQQELQQRAQETAADNASQLRDEQFRAAELKTESADRGADRQARMQTDAMKLKVAQQQQVVQTAAAMAQHHADLTASTQQHAADLATTRQHHDTDLAASSAQHVQDRASSTAQHDQDLAHEREQAKLQGLGKPPP